MRPSEPPTLPGTPNALATLNEIHAAIPEILRKLSAIDSGIASLRAELALERKARLDLDHKQRFADKRLDAMSLRLQALEGNGR